MNSQFEYKTAMDALRYTDEQKALLAEHAAQAARKAQARSHGPLLRTALIAACLTAALAVTAGATGILKSAGEAFAPIFGGSAAQTEIIDKIGYPVGASDTDNGVTITADAVMGDAYNAAIIFTITRDDGTALLPAGTEDAMLLVRGGGADLNIPGGTHGGSWFVDEDPADNTVQLIQTISADVPLNDCTATAKFDDLWMWDEESGEAVPFAEGTWKLRFDVHAPFWGQVLKLVLGLALIVAIKAGLKPLLVTLFAGSQAESFVRYFVIVIFAGIVWPLTFPFFANIGKKGKAA